MKPLERAEEDTIDLTASGEVMKRLLRELGIERWMIVTNVGRINHHAETVTIEFFDRRGETERIAHELREREYLTMEVNGCMGFDMPIDEYIRLSA